jgi:hypothetical protein
MWQLLRQQCVPDSLIESLQAYRYLPCVYIRTANRSQYVITWLQPEARAFLWRNMFCITEATLEQERIRCCNLLYLGGTRLHTNHGFLCDPRFFITRDSSQLTILTVCGRSEPYLPIASPLKWWGISSAHFVCGVRFIFRTSNVNFPNHEKFVIVVM